MNTFQSTFHHLVRANEVLNPPPPLRPAPDNPQTSLPPLQAAPAYSQPVPVPTSSTAPTLPTLHTAPTPPSSTDPTIQIVQSSRGKPKLVHGGYSYSFHKERANGYILWRCDSNNKAARDKGISCNSTALTTGDSPSSTFQFARPHSHVPDAGKIGARAVREAMKADAVQGTEKPTVIVADQLTDTSVDVQFNLPQRPSLKRMIQKTRKKHAVSTNPHLALACDRNLFTIYILGSWH